MRQLKTENFRKCFTHNYEQIIFVNEREEALHEEWSTYHEQRQQDLDLNTIQEDEEEVDFGAQEIDYSKQVCKG